MRMDASNIKRHCRERNGCDIRPKLAASYISCMREPRARDERDEIEEVSMEPTEPANFAGRGTPGAP